MDEFVDPEVPIPFEIERLTGINDAMVMGAETIGPVLGRFLEFCRGAVLVAHNASFDVGFMPPFWDMNSIPRSWIRWPWPGCSFPI